MPKAKTKTRRVRGPDGQLHTKEELAKLTASSEDSTETEETTLETVGAAKRGNKPVVQEKASRDEKDQGPVIIISWTENNRRKTKTFTCDKIQLEEVKQQSLGGTTKTVLDINLSASVLEVN